MRKRLATLIASVGSLALILCIIFTALQLTMANDSLITYEYQRLSLGKSMGMNNADIAQSCIRLMDYMEGNVDSIDIEVTVNGEKTLMFTDEQEISHMEDVRLLYQRFRSYRDIGILLTLVLYLIAAVLSFRTAMHTLCAGYCWGSFIIALFLGFFGTWAALDFSSFWTFFHQLLFWNDDWMFDPATSRMINMMPEQFFSDFILVVAVISGVVLIFLLMIAVITLLSERKKKLAAKARYLEKRRSAMIKKSAVSTEKTPAEDGSDASGTAFEGSDEA